MGARNTKLFELSKTTKSTKLETPSIPLRSLVSLAQAVHAIVIGDVETLRRYKNEVMLNQ